MLIINADDWGRTRLETDAAAECVRRRRVTSVTAMVFMQDSERAAQIAGEIKVDVGLHLNLIQPYDADGVASDVVDNQRRVARFLGSNKYASLLYNPFITRQVEQTFRAQYQEFERLYGRAPSHIDGHHHMHLCTNMLVRNIFGAGERVRPSFHIWPGEKSAANRMYRRAVDTWLRRRCRTPDYFFALGQHLEISRFNRLAMLANASVVEIMTHPVIKCEYEFLNGQEFARSIASVRSGTYCEM